MCEKIEKIEKFLQAKFKKIGQSTILQILLIIIIACFAIKFTPDWFYSFLGIEKNKESLMSFIELMIEGVFCVLVLEEYKMTRKSFELQEEELKNKYCHEVWHLVGLVFFRQLFKFKTEEEGQQYMDMMKLYLEQKWTIDKKPEYKDIKYELKEEIEKSINTYLEGEFKDIKGENVSSNVKNIFKRYKEIILTIVQELSFELLNRIYEAKLKTGDVQLTKQENEVIKMLEEKRFLTLTKNYAYRQVWGDETILSLHKSLMNVIFSKETN